MDASANGHVVLVSGKDVLIGDTIDINLQDQIGSVTNGTIFLEENHFYIRGKKIEKLGGKHLCRRAGQRFQLRRADSGLENHRPQTECHPGRLRRCKTRRPVGPRRPLALYPHFRVPGQTAAANRSPAAGMGHIRPPGHLLYTALLLGHRRTVGLDLRPPVFERARTQKRPGIPLRHRPPDKGYDHGRLPAGPPSGQRFGKQQHRLGVYR